MTLYRQRIGPALQPVQRCVSAARNRKLYSELTLRTFLLSLSELQQQLSDFMTGSLLDGHRFLARQEFLRAHHNISQKSVDTPHSFQMSCKFGKCCNSQYLLLAASLSFARPRGEPLYGVLSLFLAPLLFLSQRMGFSPWISV